MKRLLVTGGAGFIGSNFILQARQCQLGDIINLDKLTYAGNPTNLAALASDPGYEFVRGDIGDTDLVKEILSRYQPNAIINFAAESHVDRSILNPNLFIETNVVATSKLLENTLSYWQNLSYQDQQAFRFIHISTDEVFGSLQPNDPPFREETPYAPNSPYAASKAASDHLVRSYHHTYGLPTITSNCSNNYGPFQFPEKLIPLMSLNALELKPLPVYGDGQNVRDWLYVEDHCHAIYKVLAHGRVGETYNIGGKNELNNLTVVKSICSLMDEIVPSPGHSYSDLITFVKDRPGHDRRYAIDCSKLERELGWFPRESFDSGIRKTIQWYLDHPEWVQQVRSGAYQHWLKQNYEDR